MAILNLNVFSGQFRPKELILLFFLFTQLFCTRQNNTPIKEIEIKVVNGTGVYRLGWLVKWELLRSGFYVSGVGDTNQRFDRTVVVDRHNSKGEIGDKVASFLEVKKRFLGLPIGRRRRPLIEIKLDSTETSDILLILGADYREFFPRVALLF